MATRCQRDELADFLRACAARLRRRAAQLVRRLREPSARWLSRKLPSGRFLLPIGMSFFLFGWAIGPAWKIIEWSGAVQWPAIHLPLCDLRDVAVDSRGRIYVLDAFHGRVQRYSPDGEFQRGWFVLRSKVYALHVTADDRVIVRANKLLTYSSDGELLKARERQSGDRDEGLESETAKSCPYAVRRGLLPHIVDTRTGRGVVTTPWWMRLLAVPFPAFLYALIGMALMGLGSWQRWHEQAAESGAAPDRGSA
jgi:hypothetical protein